MPGSHLCTAFFNGVDCAATGTSAYIFKMVKFATFVTSLSTYWAPSQFVFLSAIFTSSSCGEYVCCGFMSVYLTSFCAIVSNLFVSCKLLLSSAWALWASTYFAQISTFPLYMIVFSSHFVSFLINYTSIYSSF